MVISRRVWFLLLGVLALVLPAGDIQAATPGSKVQIPATTSPQRWPDVGYDAQNNVYLTVIGNGPIQGRFVSADGALLSSALGPGTFNISTTAGFHQSPRVACGAGVCAVFWAEEGSPTVPTVRVISYSTGFVSAPTPIASTPGVLTEVGHGITFASGDNEFVAAWAYNGSVKFSRISLAGQLLQSTVIPAATGWKSGAYAAYNPVLDEVVVSFAGTKTVGGVPDVAFVSVQRVQNGALLGGVIDLATGGATYIPMGEFNPTTNNITVTYYKSAKFYAREVGAGGALGAVTLISSLAAYDALDVAYNANANRFLLVTHGPSVEDVAVEFTPDLVPSPYFTLTSNGGNGNFNPRVVSHGTDAKWLAVTSNNFSALWAQFAIGSTCTSNCGGGAAPPPPPPPPTGATAITAAKADFNGDLKADLLWRRDDGALALWRMTGLVAVEQIALDPAIIAPVWKLVGTGDLDGNGKPEIIWQHQNDGWLSAWFMNGEVLQQAVYLTPNRILSNLWKIVAVADMNGDTKADLIWQHDQGWLAVWYMNGTTLSSDEYLTPNNVAGSDWKIVGAGDMNGDRKPDLIWQHTSGGWLSAWLMNGSTMTSAVYLTPNRIAGSDWKIRSVIDLDGDGQTDLVWQHESGGWVAAWLMSGTTATSTPYLVPNSVATSWRLVGPK